MNDETVVKGTFEFEIVDVKHELLRLLAAQTEEDLVEWLDCLCKVFGNTTDVLVEIIIKFGDVLSEILNQINKDTGLDDIFRKLLPKNSRKIKKHGGPKRRKIKKKFLYVNPIIMGPKHLAYLKRDYYG